MHWKYLLAVLRHKYFVYREGRKLGLGRWRLLIHDWSKFTPRMWGAYARSFYGPQPRTAETKAAFDVAWLWHQRMEPHHWQSWFLRNDDGGTRALPMPRGYLLELCADWRGANKAYGDQPLISWYTETAKARVLHPDTQREVERILFGGPVLTGYTRADFVLSSPEGRAMEKIVTDDAIDKIKRHYTRVAR